MKKYYNKKVFSLYNLFWNRNLLGKIIYSLIPFLLIGSFGLILLFSNAWKMKGYNFLADYSNCFMLCYIFFFMYFVHGLFLPFFHRQVNCLGLKASPYIYKKYTVNIEKAYRIVSVCSVALSVFAIPFIYSANQAGTVNWYSKLNHIELMYYAFLIVVAWIMSARLFVSILIDTVAVYKYLQHDIKQWDYYNTDKKCGTKGLFNALSASMGFGFYFLIAVVVIICSDFNAHKNYGLDLLAYKYWWVIVSATVILAVIYFSIIIITYISLNKTIKASVNSKLHNIKLCGRKSKFLKEISTSSFSINDFFIFLLSVFFPGVAAVLQIFISII